MRNSSGRTTSVEGTLFDRSTNGKIVPRLAAKANFNKKLEDLNQGLKTCGKVYVQTVHCFSLSVVWRIVKLTQRYWFQCAEYNSSSDGKIHEKI